MDRRGTGLPLTGWTLSKGADMQKDDRPPPAPEPASPHEHEEARENLKVQEEAAEEREESRGYQ